MTVGERIKTRRVQRGMTLLALAQAVGVREATVQRYESGAIRNIKQATLAKLAEALQTTPGWLMGWEEPAGNARGEKAYNGLQTKVLLLARHLERLPQEQQERILRNFEDTIDTYLDAMKIRKQEEHPG